MLVYCRHDSLNLFLFRTSSVTVNGSLYQLGCMVSYRIVDLMPQFAELADIVTHLECGVILILQLYETVCFNEHYHAYEVEATEEMVGAQPVSLLDHYPLLRHQCGTHSELTVVCPKYDLI